MDTSLKARMAPHLGLLTIARIVEDAGHSVEVVNENLGLDAPSDKVDLVGISASVDVLSRAKELADAYAKFIASSTFCGGCRERRRRYCPI